MFCSFRSINFCSLYQTSHQFGVAHGHALQTSEKDIQGGSRSVQVSYISSSSLLHETIKCINIRCLKYSVDNIIVVRLLKFIALAAKATNTKPQNLFHFLILMAAWHLSSCCMWWTQRSNRVIFHVFKTNTGYDLSLFGIFYHFHTLVSFQRITCW